MQKIGEKFLRWLRLRKVIGEFGENENMCDIGCGDGTFLKEMSKNIKSGTGYDADTNDSAYNNITVKKVDVENKLPSPDNSFSVVTMLAVLEHIANEGGILKEVFRVLVPSGKIIVTVPTYFNKPFGEFLAYKLKIIEEKHYRDHKRYYNRQELSEALKNAGFKIKKIHYWEFGMNLLAVAEK